ncbi:unnamed protein product, partial [Allacma fusca]
KILDLKESLDNERTLRDKYKSKSKNLNQKLRKFQQDKSV